MSNYFYSEGYVYRGKETVCAIYGVDDNHQQIEGEKIVKLLNADKKKKK